jgi:DNA repair photolyase
MVAEDEYMEVLDRELAHIQITVTSTDPDISRKYEKAPLPEARIAAIEKLDAEGFDVCIRVSPFVPEWIDKARINAIRCQKMLVEFLRVNTWIERWLGDMDLSAYTLKEHGYKHLPLEAKKAALAGFEKEQLSVCEDVDEHHTYWEANMNPNPDDCCNLRL